MKLILSRHWASLLNFLTYALDLDERPRTEKEDDGTTLILLRIFFQGEKLDVPYISIPLGVILTDNLIITVCKRHNVILDEVLRTRVVGFRLPNEFGWSYAYYCLLPTNFLLIYVKSTTMLRS